MIIRNRIASLGYVMKDETVNHKENEYSELEQKEYKTRHDWVGKVIHWELWKRSTFYHANKNYAHKSEITGILRTKWMT